MNKICAALILYFSLVTFSFATALNKTDLQHTVNLFYQQEAPREHFTGVAVTVLERDHKPLSVYAGTIGEETSTAVNATHLFQTGSITKSFVAALILRIANDPKTAFSLDTSITHFFPEYPEWQGVTVRELLNMTSGIPNYLTDAESLAHYSSDPYRYYFSKYWVKSNYRKLLFKPGSKYQYSNTNYLLLGMLIERLTHQTLAKEIQTQLIDPLELKNTYYVEGTLPITEQKRLVHGYQYQAAFDPFIPLGTDVKSYNLSYLNAAGAMVSDSADVAKWIEALFTPGKIVNKNAYQSMLGLVSMTSGRAVTNLRQEKLAGYGLGIIQKYSVKLKSGVNLYQGLTFGYRTMYANIPAKDLTIVVMVNSGYHNDHYDSLLKLLRTIGGF